MPLPNLETAFSSKNNYSRTSSRLILNLPCAVTLCRPFLRDGKDTFGQMIQLLFTGFLLIVYPNETCMSVVITTPQTLCDRKNEVFSKGA